MTWYIKTGDGYYLRGISPTYRVWSGRDVAYEFETRDEAEAVAVKIKYHPHLAHVFKGKVVEE